MSSAAEASAKMAAKAAAAGQDPENKQQKKKPEGDEIEDEDADEIQYKPYRPSKLKFGRDHPDPVVENASLAGKVHGGLKLSI